MSELKTTPLNDAHIAAGARMVPFAGYSMPVQYTSIIAESEAVRTGAGMFDVSHMARLHLTGDRVEEYLEWVTTNDVSKLTDGKGQYSMLPNANGGVVDDIIVYRVSDKDFHMVVNASNHVKDVAHLDEQNKFGVVMTDNTESTAMIAVQGPKAADIIKSLCDDPAQIDDAGMFGIVNVEVGGVRCFGARSGYTGEDGFELVCAADEAVKLWDALVAAGVVPGGLGSRDVLRVEAGLPLYGHELGDDLSPISAGLGWVISKTKSFLGSEHINEARENGTPQKLQGVQLDSKRRPEPGFPVLVDGLKVGEICSGVYSPMLECGIGFAFLNSDVKIGTECAVEIRGKAEPAKVVSKRFFKRES
ncbi:MAG: glycine cleavage system aminomethyltransferase GcvT [Armatimonadetes bacterium]|nr:glycine cleavage system aminomethyltransferase GcvT [Armatimonadota bacterium]